ncbi:MAG: alkaline phosphatase family protein, partial [Blastocatellia bacterium]
ANQLPRFSLIIPNAQDDAHDCPAGMATCTDSDKLNAADTWLQTNIAPLISIPAFQKNGLLIIVFDESIASDTANGGGQVPMLVISPLGRPGYSSSTLFQHQSTLSLVCEALGLTTYPGAAASATPMAEFFGAPAETVLLADQFNQSTIDTSKWTPNDLFSGFTDTNVAVADTGQQLDIGPLSQAASGSHYNGLRSAATFNFTGSYCYVQIVTPPANDTAADAMLTVGTDVNNFYRMYIESGNLIVQRKAAGSKSVLLTQSYDPVNDQYLRIRHDASTGSAVFETAPNNGGVPGSWKAIFSEPWNVSIPLTGMIFEIKAGTWQSEVTAPGTVVFDNFRAARL